MMRTQLVGIAALVLGFVVCPPNGHGDDNKIDPDIVAQDKYWHYNKWAKEYETAAVSRLKDAAWVKKHPKGTLAAVQYLTQIRSAKGAPALAELLLYERPGKPTKGIALEVRCPAYAALLAIGKPSAEALLLKIGTSATGQDYQEAAMKLLAEVLGKDAVIKTIDKFQEDARSYRRQHEANGKYEAYKDYDPIKIVKFKTEFRSLYLSKG
jgi:hypothetical protein